MFLKHGKRWVQEGQCHFVESFMQIKAEEKIPVRESMFFYLVFPLRHIVIVYSQVSMN